MDKIQQIRDVLSKNKLVLFAYLFGSRALNKAGNMSDWDIAVYIEDDKLVESLKELATLGQVTTNL